MSNTPTDRRTRYAFRLGAPSVTTVTDVLNKPGLLWAAVNETALFAIHQRSEWADLDVDGAYDRLRKHHAGIWRDRASVGTRVHGVCEAWCRGESADVDPDCAPFVDGVERWFDAWQPEVITFERAVDYSGPGHHHDYVGTLDLIARLADGRIWLLDWKTSGRQESDPYVVEWTLQLAGYRFAQRMAIFAEDATVTDWEPMPNVDAAATVVLRPDGSFEMYELPASRDAHGTFLRLRDVWQWQRDTEKWAKSAGPTPPPGQLGEQLQASLDEIAREEVPA